MRVAAEEYHAEFAQKESTIAMLTSDAEAQKAQMQQKIDQLRTDMEVCQPCCLLCTSAFKSYTSPCFSIRRLLSVSFVCSLVCVGVSSTVSISKTAHPSHGLCSSVQNKVLMSVDRG